MMRPQHMATNVMQPTATSATNFLNLPFVFMAAYYTMIRDAGLDLRQMG